MKRLYFILSLFLTITASCNKYDGPYVETVEDYYFTKIGNEQKTTAGNFLPDSTGLSVSNAFIQGKEKLSAHFTVISGGGTVDPQNIEFYNHIATTRWKTGKSSSIQQLCVEIYKDNKLINTSYLNAAAFRYNIWDTVSTFPDINIKDVLADTIAQQTLMIDYTSLYQQKENYFNWKFKRGFYTPDNMEIDGAGNIYISAYDQYAKIFKSTDHGNSWTECQPADNKSNLYRIRVTANGYVWASVLYEGKNLLCSRDGGNTWSVDTAGLQDYDALSDIYYLSNGNILLLTSRMRLYQSIDDGKSWINMQVPQYPLKLYVTKNDDIIIINQDYGISIYKSSDLGQTYIRKITVSPEYGTTMEKSIQEINGIYYVLIPGYGIFKTTDFETYETMIKNNKMVFLYKDLTGTLIARDFVNEYTFYYKEN